MERMMNFPIIDPPINSTTAFVLQKTKPTQNDLDRHLANLRMLQTTYKRILSGKNTPERKPAVNPFASEQIIQTMTMPAKGIVPLPIVGGQPEQKDK